MERTAYYPAGLLVQSVGGEVTKPYTFTAAALAYLLAHFTHQDIHAYPITMPLSPYAYRVMLGGLWPVLNDTIGPLAASWLVWFLCFALFMFLVDTAGERLGIAQNTRLALMASLPTLLFAIFLQPGGAMWNGIEMVFFAAAFVMILDGRTWALYPLVMLATLNRETAVFIPLMYFAVTRDWKHTAGMGLVWAVTYGAIRFIVGPLPSHLSLGFILDVNLGAGFGRFFLGLVIISWLFWYGWRGWRLAPERLRRAAYVIPPYLLLVGVFGIWHEWRLILSVAPLLVLLVGVGLIERKNEEIEIQFRDEMSDWWDELRDYQQVKDE